MQASGVDVQARGRRLGMGKQDWTVEVEGDLSTGVMEGTNEIQGSQCNAGSIEGIV